MNTAPAARTRLRLRLLGVATASSLAAMPAFAQDAEHSTLAMPSTRRPAAHGPATEPPVAKPATATGQPPDPHAGHAMPMPSAQPRERIPVVTPADRIAAFPALVAHAAHDNTIQSYWLLDHLDAWNAGTGTGIGWEAQGWIGTDRHRLWLRSAGERIGGATESADVELRYGRSVARWWEVVAGVRHDFGTGPARTFVALGVIGLAPQKFEVAATAYLGPSGQTAARVQAGYDTLLSNRLTLQWLAEANFYGKQDAGRGIGPGLNTVEAGLRLRYEFTRQFAPYIGMVGERAFGGAADLRRAKRQDIHDTRFVVGLRVWF